jgi:hypothetical protein
MSELMAEAVQTAETLVNVYRQSTRRCNPADSHLLTLRRENFRIMPMKSEHNWDRIFFLLRATKRGGVNQFFFYFVVVTTENKGY